MTRPMQLLLVLAVIILAFAKNPRSFGGGAGGPNKTVPTPKSARLPLLINHAVQDVPPTDVARFLRSPGQLLNGVVNGRSFESTISPSPESAKLSSSRSTPGRSEDTDIYDAYVITARLLSDSQKTVRQREAEIKELTEQLRRQEKLHNWLSLAIIVAIGGWVLLGLWWHRKWQKRRIKLLALAALPGAGISAFIATITGMPASGSLTLLSLLTFGPLLAALIAHTLRKITARRVSVIVSDHRYEHRI